jgi:hypothetical protein
MWEARFHTRTKIRKIIYIFFYNLIFTFRYHTGRQNILNGMESNIPEFSLLLISSWMQFWFLNVVPKCYLNFATLSGNLLAVVILSVANMSTADIVRHAWLYECAVHAKRDKIEVNVTVTTLVVRNVNDVMVAPTAESGGVCFWRESSVWSRVVSFLLVQLAEMKL